MLFLDASALTKAYVDELGDANVRGLLLRARGALYLSEFVALEVLTSIRNAHRGLPRQDYLNAVQRFWTDYESRFGVVEVNGKVVADALSLTTQNRGARARSMDVLHVATALRLQSGGRAREGTIVTSDRDMADLASECGLRTFDPSREPLSALPRLN